MPEIFKFQEKIIKEEQIDKTAETENYPNILDVDGITYKDGYYLNGYGQEVALEGASYIEQYIKIDPNESYELLSPFTGAGCQYNPNKVFIRYLAGTENQWTTPNFISTSCYLRINVPTNDKTSVILRKVGTKKKLSTLNWLEVNDNNFNNDVISMKSINPNNDIVQVGEKVYLDRSQTLLDGYWMENNTLYTTAAFLKRTDYIEVIPNATYDMVVLTANSLNGESNGKIFDKDKNIIADLGVATNNVLTYTMPSNAKYMQLNVSLNTTNMVFGSSMAVEGINYQPSFTTKSLKWLEVNSSNINDNELLNINDRLNNLNNDLVKYKYGDSINKPFDFQGKSIVAFGDSITYGISSPNLFNLNDSGKSYIKLFVNKFSMSLDNRAISGTCITDTDDTQYSIYKKITSFTLTKDFILIAGGINDYDTGKPLGTFADTSKYTFYGALRGICEYLTTNCPTSTVIFITPTNVTKSSNNVILPLNTYRNAIYEIATLYGFNVVDGSTIGLPNEAGNWGNEMIVDSDGCHPTEKGHALYFRGLCGKLC